jgi:hypothetical protein
MLPISIKFPGAISSSAVLTLHHPRDRSRREISRDCGSAAPARRTNRLRASVRASAVPVDRRPICTRHPSLIIHLVGAHHANRATQNRVIVLPERHSSCPLTHTNLKNCDPLDLARPPNQPERHPSRVDRSMCECAGRRCNPDGNTIQSDRDLYELASSSRQSYR